MNVNCDFFALLVAEVLLVIFFEYEYCSVVYSVTGKCFANSAELPFALAYSC